ncbi:MAG: hypothetical protein OXF75_08920 [Acidimicrobiaceae bacterium]|nr:hypothetical protein [Acidimicrobiaceae bacterium]
MTSEELPTATAAPIGALGRKFFGTEAGARRLSAIAEIALAKPLPT